MVERMTLQSPTNIEKILRRGTIVIDSSGKSFKLIKFDNGKPVFDHEGTLFIPDKNTLIDFLNKAQDLKEPDKEDLDETRKDGNSTEELEKFRKREAIEFTADLLSKELNKILEKEEREKGGIADKDVLAFLKEKNALLEKNPIKYLTDEKEKAKKQLQEINNSDHKEKQKNKKQALLKKINDLQKAIVVLEEMQPAVSELESQTPPPPTKKPGVKEREINLGQKLYEARQIYFKALLSPTKNGEELGRLRTNYIEVVKAIEADMEKKGEGKSEPFLRIERATEKRFIEKGKPKRPTNETPKESLWKKLENKIKVIENAGKIDLENLSSFFREKVAEGVSHLEKHKKLAEIGLFVLGISTSYLSVEKPKEYRKYNTKNTIAETLMRAPQKLEVIIPKTTGALKIAIGKPTDTTPPAPVIPKGAEQAAKKPVKKPKKPKKAFDYTPGDNIATDKEATYGKNPEPSEEELIATDEALLAEVNADMETGMQNETGRINNVLETILTKNKAEEGMQELRPTEETTPENISKQEKVVGPEPAPTPIKMGTANPYEKEAREKLEKKYGEITIPEPTQVKTIEETTKVLSPMEADIKYIFGNESSYKWLLSKDTPAYETIEIDDLLGRYLRELVDYTNPKLKPKKSKFLGFGKPETTENFMKRCLKNLENSAKREAFETKIKGW